MPPEVLSIPYNHSPQALRREFALLQLRADSDDGEVLPESMPAQHDPKLNAISFYTSVDGEVVSYAAAVRKTIEHEDQTFEIAGLSYVATDLAYQGQGFGTRTVAAASRWIEQSGADFGIFTCDPPLAHFYARAGGWTIASNVTLIGSHHKDALRSDTLGKVVLIRFFSEKALAAQFALSNATISLNFPIDQFL